MSDTWRVYGFENDLVALSALDPILTEDATPVPGNVIDTNSVSPDLRRTRILIVCTADVTAHGVTFSVAKSAAVGMTNPTDALPSGDLTKLVADGVQAITIKRDAAKPFIQVTATGDSADTSATVAAVAVFIRDAI